MGISRFGHVKQSVKVGQAANNTGTARKVSLCLVVLNFMTKGVSVSEKWCLMH